MERKTPIAYPDGVYEIAGQDRPNVLLIANLSQNGLTGLGSDTRTAFFIYFGKKIQRLLFLESLLNLFIISIRSTSGRGGARCPACWLHSRV